MLQKSQISADRPRVAAYREFALHSLDDFQLSARLWEAPSVPNVENVALINAGAGIVSEYYDRFAAYLADNGIPTLLYDYRGIGRSRPKSLRGFQASVEEWGSKDCAAALNWLYEHYPGSKRIVIGHSIGGFVTGFVTNGSLVDRMLLVGAHTGYWRDYATHAQPLMIVLWHVLMPLSTLVFGYFPGKRLHMLEDLPKGVAMEWATRIGPDFWSRLKRDDGTPNTERIEMLLRRFAAIRATTVAVRFTDDPFATARATERILKLYPNASTKRMVLNMADGDGQPVGHFGFFRSRFRATLWPRVLNALLSVKPK